MARGILVFTTLFLLVTGASALALEGESGFDPSVLRIAEDDYLGKEAADIRMQDQEGKSLRLSDLRGKPLVISLVYFVCPHTCKPLNEGLGEALARTGMEIGKDFRLLTLSFNGKETGDDARAFRADLKAKLHQPDALPAGFDNWIFATASEEDIKKLTGSVGYRFFYSREDRAYVHPNVSIFLSPDGRIMRYIFGIKPDAFDLKMAALEASKGKTGKLPLSSLVTLACYKYDPQTRGYIINLPAIFMSMGGFMACMTGLISIVVYRKKRLLQKK
ncbi:MAG: SCO family protein [Thermodesulfovibrionales bacterium]|jgi:protein SCO1/2